MIIKQNSLTKKALYSLLVMSLLATIVSCGCVNPTSPKRLADPDMQSNSHVVDFPENTITINAPVDLNIMNFVRPGSNLTIDDVSITFSPGVDMFIADTNYLNINLANGTIVGDIKLNQRLDCENPIDDNVDNDYEIATFNIVTPDDSINDEFKIIVRITDVEVEVTKIEILIDKFHLPAGNVLRGIKELYLYEDLAASDPNGTGDDNKNFLSANLIASTSVIGEMYPGSDITKLYDKDDVNDGFLIDTANTNMSNIYHRLTFDFKEKVNLKKIAIRSQGADYGGFYFIIRDENNHILHVQRANASSARGSADADADATSIYSYVPSYGLSRYPISDFDIKKYNNNDITLYENTTNVFLIDRFYVKQGYEYERGFVKFSIPGADIDKFNTNNVFFVYNQLMGLSFKEAPDFEMADDANGDNTYEVGTVTITNVDGGRIDFPLSVKTLDIHSTVELKTNELGQNAVNLTIDVYTFDVIENLLEFVDFEGLRIDPASIGDVRYNYRLGGDDASYFKIDNNRLKTTNPFGFISNTSIHSEYYNLQVEYIPDQGISQFLNIAIRVVPLNTNVINYTMSLYTSNIIENLLDLYDTNVLGVDPSLVGMYYEFIGDDASYFKLEEDALKTVGDYGFRNSFDNNGRYNFQIHYSPKDGGIRHQVVDVSINVTKPDWNKITSSVPWADRFDFQAVVLSNNDILVMNGYKHHVDNYFRFEGIRTYNSGRQFAIYSYIYSQKNDVWRSSDGGTNWTEVTPATRHWDQHSFQAKILPNNDILLMGGRKITWNEKFLRYSEFAVPPDDTFPSGYRPLNLRAYYYDDTLDTVYKNDIWRSSDGGRSWNQITARAPWIGRSHFQSVVLNNNHILVMGGLTVTGLDGVRNSDVYLSENGGVNWENVTPIAGRHWSDRFDFQAVVLTNNDVLVMGGIANPINGFANYRNDIWISKNEGRSWSQIPATGHWSPRINFKALVLENNNILVLGGLDNSNPKNDIWVSENGGTNWMEIDFAKRWSYKAVFQTVVLNDTIVLMGDNGYGYNREVWMLKLEDVYNKNYEKFLKE